MRRLRLLLPPLIVIATASTGRAESEAPPPPPIEIDLLIVVDTSPGMAEELAVFAPQIGGLVGEIARSTSEDFQETSLHVGVVTADLGAGPHALAGCVSGGDGARFAPAPATCNGPTDLFLRHTRSDWGDLDRNYSGTIEEAVDCMIPRVADGCVVQQPLAAANRALDGTVTDNLGFLRPGAALAVLIVTHQEDCSTTDPTTLFDPASGPVTSYRCAAQGWTCSPPIDGSTQAHTGCYVAAASPLTAPYEAHLALRQVKSEPWRIAVGVLRGPSEPVATVAGPAIAASCGGGTPRTASPALRVDAFANLFDHRSIGSVCEDLLNPFQDAVYAAANDTGPGPDGDAGHGFCDGGGWGVDSGEGTFPFQGDGCSAGGGAGTGAIVILLGLPLLLARRAKRKERLAVDL